MHYKRMHTYRQRIACTNAALKKYTASHAYTHMRTYIQYILSARYMWNINVLLKHTINTRNIYIYVCTHVCSIVCVSHLSFCLSNAHCSRPLPLDRWQPLYTTNQHRPRQSDVTAWTGPFLRYKHTVFNFTNLKLTLLCGETFTLQFVQLHFAVTERCKSVTKICLFYHISTCSMCALTALTHLAVKQSM
jgi:hypothetical protein